MPLYKVIPFSLAAALSLGAQELNPAQEPGGIPAHGGGSPEPLYRVNVVARSTQAVNYLHRAGATPIGFRGTILLPGLEGEAKVETKRGVTEIDAKFKNLAPPFRFGHGYLTYVLWAITPDGRATNLGEVSADNKDRARLRTATELQTFALVVTAEPYFAVTQPSDVVVAENEVLPATRGEVQTVEAKYELLKRGEYTFDKSAAEQRVRQHRAEKVSMDEYYALVELYQARNAVQLAEHHRANQYAADSLERAKQQLERAENFYRADPKNPQIVSTARRATQTAEDARIISLRRQRDEDRSPRAVPTGGEL